MRYIRQKKLTGLDAEVYAIWDAFPIGKESLPEQDQKPALEALFAKACPEGEWKVGRGIAEIVSTCLWFNSMILHEYDRAEEVMDRCLAHPEQDERRSVSLSVKLQIARLGKDPSGPAAQALKDLIDCGIYRPAGIAREIAFLLSGLASDLPPETQLSTGVTSLIVRLAGAHRSSKRLKKACELATTWRELEKLLERYRELAAQHPIPSIGRGQSKKSRSS